MDVHEPLSRRPKKTNNETKTYKKCLETETFEQLNRTKATSY